MSIMIDKHCEKMFSILYEHIVIDLICVSLLKNKKYYITQKIGGNFDFKSRIEIL